MNKRIKFLMNFLPITAFFIFMVHFEGASSLLIAQTNEKKVSLAALEEISDLIMSPGCAYKFTLTNCPSVQAVELRDLIKGKLATGETKEQILQYLVDLYGTRVLAAPEKKGFFLLAWWLPYFVIADGAIIIAVIIVFWKKRSKSLLVSASAGDNREKIHAYENEIEEELKKMDL